MQNIYPLRSSSRLVDVRRLSMISVYTRLMIHSRQRDYMIPYCNIYRVIKERKPSTIEEKKQQNYMILRNNFIEIKQPYCLLIDRTLL